MYIHRGQSSTLAAIPQASSIWLVFFSFLLFEIGSLTSLELAKYDLMACL